MRPRVSSKSSRARSTRFSRTHQNSLLAAAPWLLALIFMESRWHRSLAALRMRLHHWPP